MLLCAEYCDVQLTRRLMPKRSRYTSPARRERSARSAGRGCTHHVGNVAHHALARCTGRFGEAPNATVPTHILRITRTHHTCATRMVEVLDRAQRNRHVITFDAAEFFRTFAPAVANAPDHSTILSPVGELDRETRVDRTASIHPAMTGIGRSSATCGRSSARSRPAVPPAWSRAPNISPTRPKPAKPPDRSGPLVEDAAVLAADLAQAGIAAAQVQPPRSIDVRTLRI